MLALATVAQFVRIAPFASLAFLAAGRTRAFARALRTRACAGSSRLRSGRRSSRRGGCPSRRPSPRGRLSREPSRLRGGRASRGRSGAAATGLAGEGDVALGAGGVLNQRSIHDIQPELVSTATGAGASGCGVATRGATIGAGCDGVMPLTTASCRGSVASSFICCDRIVFAPGCSTISNDGGSGSPWFEVVVAQALDRVVRRLEVPVRHQQHVDLEARLDRQHLACAFRSAGTSRRRPAPARRPARCSPSSPLPA